MTRINLVDPGLLLDAHLGAEYRELPRVWTLARRAVNRGERPDDPRNPREFTLGTGHVRFFYPRLAWVQRRYAALVAECLKRGRKVTFKALPEAHIPDEWFVDWEPTAKDVELSTARLLERGGLRSQSRRISDRQHKEI